jgi:hypothetical protein
MLKQFIKKRRNGQMQKVGMFFGTTVKDQIVIGYSLCSAKDVFNKDIALVMAMGRALSAHVSPCPPSIYNEAIEFAERCEKYFKDAHLIYAEEA